MRISIKRFCKKHGACKDGRDWALENCRTMKEVWDTIEPEWLVWIATRDGVLPEEEQRLFAVWCCRQRQPLMKDKRSIAAVDVAERFAHGQATRQELAEAWEAASAAAWAACEEARAAASGR